MKICLAASAGGHTSQLLKTRESWNRHKTFWVTTTKVVAERLQKFGNVYVIGECNRQQPLRVVAALIRCLMIVIRERPDVVMSTGAAVGCLMCFLGKLMGAKIIWIDSITNVERISLSGRLVRPIADLLLVQWLELSEKHDNIEYAGTLI